MDGKPSRSTIDLNKETLELEADTKERAYVASHQAEQLQKKLAKADPGCSNKAMTPATERSVEVKATIPSKMKVEPIVLVNSRVNKRTNNELQEFFWGEETKTMDGKPSRSTIDLNKETLELEADSKEPRKVIDEFKQKYAQAMNDLKVLERTLAYQKHQQ
ncbi:hypothetical protein DAPPUDRAFT_279806, partial [Daphnia pulex]